MLKITLAALMAGAALTAAATSSAATPAKRFSVETTTVQSLLMNPISRPVIMACWPGLQNFVTTEIAGQTLRSLESRPEAGLDDAMLATIQNQLDAALNQTQASVAAPMPPVQSTFPP